MKKIIGNARGLAVLTMLYLIKSRRSREGNRVGEDRFEVVEKQQVTTQYVEEIRRAVLPPEPLIPRIGWDQIRFPSKSGEK